MSFRLCVFLDHVQQGRLHLSRVRCRQEVRTALEEVDLRLLRRGEQLDVLFRDDRVVYGIGKSLLDFLLTIDAPE